LEFFKIFEKFFGNFQKEEGFVETQNTFSEINAIVRKKKGLLLCKTPFQNLMRL